MFVCYYLDLEDLEYNDLFPATRSLHFVLCMFSGPRIYFSFAVGYVFSETHVCHPTPDNGSPSWFVMAVAYVIERFAGRLRL
jgi:hypothetical protein